mmetsp:Transcript_20309/g.67801  ORF Transcript_20309/g.67801 Transcript_20309/m.67801 type:complete len:239 (+) Transcript_20309:479-1195(+)
MVRGSQAGARGSEGGSGTRGYDLKFTASHEGLLEDLLLVSLPAVEELADLISDRHRHGLHQHRVRLVHHRLRASGHHDRHHLRILFLALHYRHQHQRRLPYPLRAPQVDPAIQPPHLLGVLAHPGLPVSLPQHPTMSSRAGEGDHRDLVLGSIGRDAVQQRLHFLLFPVHQGDLRDLSIEGRHPEPRVLHHTSLLEESDSVRSDAEDERQLILLDVQLLVVMHYVPQQHRQPLGRLHV